MKKHLLVGCSFTDPCWQDEIPWSIHYSKSYQESYIVAKAGMGWKGICTEAYIYAQNLYFDHCVIMLPTLWRMDTELNHEGTVCNAMVSLVNDAGVLQPGTRKWLVSGGLHYRKSLSGIPVKILDMLYKYKGLLPILREHVLALQLLILYLKSRNISYTITAIADPMQQLLGLDDNKDDAVLLLESVEYKNWLKFNGQFIDNYIGHTQHPSTEEHKQIGDYIWQNQVT